MTRKLTFEAGHSKLHWDFSTSLKVCLLQVAFCQTSVIFFLRSYTFWFLFSVLYSVFAAITMLSTLQPKTQSAFPFKSTCYVFRCNHPESLVKFRALSSTSFLLSHQNCFQTSGSLFSWSVCVSICFANVAISKILAI